MKSRIAFIMLSVVVITSLIFVGCAAPAPAPAPAPVPKPAPAPAPKPAPAPAPAPTLELMLGSPFPEGTQLSSHPEAFIPYIEEKTNGRISFKTFYGGSLVGFGSEVLEAPSKGVVDISVALYIYAPGKVPLGCFENNFLFNDPDLRTQAKIRREMYSRIPALQAEMAQFNIGPPLVFGTHAPYSLLTRMPIPSIADLEGKKIGHTPVEYAPALESAGAVSVIMPAGEMYNALEHGVVDGISLPIEVITMFKLHEVAKNFTYFGINSPCHVSLWINLDTWNKLTPEDQELFIEAGKVGEEAWHQRVEREVKEGVVTMEKAGVTFYELSQADIDAFRKGLPDVPGDWARNMEAAGKPAAWDIIDMYIELSEKAGWEFPPHWGAR